MKRKVPETVGACFALIERDMLRGPWVMGEHYTSATPTSSPSPSGWRPTASIFNATPKIADHFKRMSDRPAIRKVMDAQKA